MHFTYAAVGEDLQQGDLLQRTDALNDLLNDVHPYYAKSEYSHFLVLTQTCDLVRRDGGRCAAQYANIAAVRPLDTVLTREAENWRSGWLSRQLGANSRDSWPRLKNFLERLLNNNNHEYFYLHEDASIGLSDRSVAYLRLSVAVRAHDHYDILMQARLASLKEPFQAKLGWLVGDIFSRVGTDDWSPHHKGPDEWNTFVTEILEQSLDWVDENQLKEAQRVLKKADVEGDPREDLLQLVRSTKIQSKKDQVIEAVLTELVNASYLEEGQRRKVFNRLRSNSIISSLVK